MTLLSFNNLSFFKTINQIFIKQPNHTEKSSDKINNKLIVNRKLISVLINHYLIET